MRDPSFQGWLGVQWVPYMKHIVLQADILSTKESKNDFVHGDEVQAGSRQVWWPGIQS